MPEQLPEDWPHFYTATIQSWKHLLQEEKYKAVITDALKFLVENKKVRVNAFVRRGGHLIWQALQGYTLAQAQASFKKHSSKQFLKLLKADEQIQIRSGE